MDIIPIRHIAEDIGLDHRVITALVERIKGAPVFHKNGRLYADPEQLIEWLDRLNVPIPEDYDEDDLDLEEDDDFDDER